MPVPPTRGQGSLEYLLLIGGGVLVVVVVLMLLVYNALPQSNQVVQENQQYYTEELCEKSNLFTPAECAALDGGNPGDFRNFNLSYSTAAPAQVTLSWMWPADDGVFQGGAIAGYEIYFCSPNACTFTNYASLSTGVQLLSQAGFNPASNPPIALAAGQTVPPIGAPGSISSIGLTLQSGNYLFGIVATDDAGLHSNVVSNQVTV